MNDQPHLDALARASQGGTYVLGPDPIGWDTVLLPLSAAQYVKEIADLIAADITVGEFDDAISKLTGSSPYEEFEDYDLEDGWRDERFVLEDVPGYGDGYFPPRAGTIMLDELDDDVFELIGDLCEVHDSMGGVPQIWIESEAEEAIANRLRAAGFEVVDWSAV